jgi:hypothetical protein
VAASTSPSKSHLTLLSTTPSGPCVDHGDANTPAHAGAFLGSGARVTSVFRRRGPVNGSHMCIAICSKPATPAPWSCQLDSSPSGSCARFANRSPDSSKASGQLLGLATRARALAIASLQRRHSRSGPCCLGMGTARIASPEPAPSGTPAGPVERTISRTRPAASRQYAPASPCLRIPPMLPTAQG